MEPRDLRVGIAVYDTERQAHAVLTDIRAKGREHPLYVLRPVAGGTPTWNVSDPARLRPDTPR